MDDSEKLTALKKAYADIILNTAKEAAARIMVSERKSTRFQQELAYTKDEALRMVLRLKQMLDSKVKEAELTSLSQQKKIEELEAQLQEAEEIVRDLRAELRETQAELENVTKKHEAHPPVEQNMKDEIAANGSFLQENRLEPSDATVHSEPDLQFESVSVSDTVCPTVNGIENGSTFCVSRDHANSFYIHNPDFASIVIRRKEPELYRNGCTQRIRALERSIFDGNVSVAGDLDNARDETLAGAHEEDKEATVAANGKANIICENEKPDELEVVKEGADLVKCLPLIKNRRFRKRKTHLSRLHSHRLKETTKESYLSANGKANIICENEKPDELEVVKEGADLVKCLPLIKNRRFRKRKTHLSRLHSDQLKETTKESYLSAAKDSPHVLDDNDTSKVNSSIAHENEARKNLMSHVAEAPTDATATVEQPDKLQVVKAGGDLIKDLVHRKRKRFRIRRTRRSRLHSDLVKEANKESNLTRAKDSDHVLGNNNNDSSTVNSSVAHENEAQKDLMSPFAKAPKDATTAVERLGSHTNTEKGEIFLKGCSSKNKIEDDKESLDKSDLTRQESLSTESIKVPSCTDVVEVAGDGSPDKMDSKVSNKDEKVSSRFENDKLLKYTFQRKRKKGSVSSGDVGCSPDNSSSKKICGEKQNGHAEPQKSCTMTESSRESRRLAQVARQLISLSEKKWWQ
ncbi:uncharacterized protein LOC127073872 isoform X1 [Lathyrus oleraceus]|uniref:Uncharacterized protein n=2 Tax=Pisum sativum TaxID=3888 RepID=A0A9D4XDK7_PEA|nr:uncharacterized protein LOC127073872 isoform X1 [Pisum sativum]KAI5416890.1 hypothetical protein KIW84_041769 [Pisum sativum]